MSRRGVKHVLKSIKELASNAKAMDALSDQLRELLAKATEQMVFYLTDEEDNIDLLRSVKIKKNRTENRTENFMFRNKIQKVFVMLNEVEPPETDHIESAAETLISKQSINFNDNPSANPPSK